MEVINTTEFTPTEFLVGQQKTTISHGDADAAALMAMLSSGFYSTPLRTMIQEMLFNAWDAHKMVGKEDTPIDVYLNSSMSRQQSCSGHYSCKFYRNPTRRI